MSTLPEREHWGGGGYTTFPNSIIDSGVLAFFPENAARVYLAYCRHADFQSGFAWPSNETLAHETGRSIRAVQRGRKWLVKNALLEIEDATAKGSARGGINSDGTGRSAGVYLLDPEPFIKRCRQRHSSQPQRVTLVSPKGDSRCLHGVTVASSKDDKAVSPKQISEHIKRTDQENTPASRARVSLSRKSQGEPETRWKVLPVRDGLKRLGCPDMLLAPFTKIAEEHGWTEAALYAWRRYNPDVKFECFVEQALYDRQYASYIKQCLPEVMAGKEPNGRTFIVLAHWRQSYPRQNGEPTPAGAVR